MKTTFNNSLELTDNNIVPRYADYAYWRGVFIKAWNSGIAIKNEIDQKYGRAKLRLSKEAKQALNNMITILFETGQVNSINRALFIILSDNEIQTICDKFPKTPKGLRYYVDEDNTKRLIQERRPNRRILYNPEFTENKTRELNVLEDSSTMSMQQKTQSDQELFRDVDIRPYNSWSFHTDNRFGLEYPGKIAPDLVFNTLYFYTQAGDLVVDPMAGGGTVGDCCQEVNRNCLMYDLNPVRPDIKPHDIRKGIPDEAYNAKLLFWDPPYYKKKLEAYGPQSISALDRTQYLDIFRQVATDSYKAGIQRIALVMSDYISQDGNGNPDDNVFIWDYVERFKTQGWNPINHIFCHLKTEQIHGSTIIKYRREKLFAAISRSLVIFDRTE